MHLHVHEIFIVHLNCNITLAGVQKCGQQIILNQQRYTLGAFLHAFSDKLYSLLKFLLSSIIWVIHKPHTLISHEEV